MLLAAGWFCYPDTATRKRLATIAVAAVAVYLMVLVELRLLYGPRPLITVYGRHPGMELLRYNFCRARTWWNIVSTLSIVPVIAVIFYRDWQPVLKAFFWAIVPVWLLVHAFCSVLAESRVLLVPQATVFIPGALWGART